MRPLLNLRTYTVVRTTAPDPVNGRKVQGTQSTFTITANVQPVTGKQLLALPEGRRTERNRRIFTSTELYLPGRVVNGVRYDADQLVYNDEHYEVWEVGDWAADNYQCYASRIESP